MLKHLILKIIFLFFFVNNIQCQDSLCKVSLKKISGKYSGGCKRGKADGYAISQGEDKYEGYFKSGYPEGEGVYTFKNGDVFTGTFSRGIFHGKGSLKKVGVEGIDSLLEGYWYKGIFHPITKDYELISCSPKISKFEITRQILNPNQTPTITIRTKRKNANSYIGNPRTHLLMGNYTETQVYDTPETASIIFVGVKFPFRLECENGLMIDYVFQINETGNWEIEVVIDFK